MINVRFVDAAANDRFLHDLKMDRAPVPNERVHFRFPEGSAHQLTVAGAEHVIDIRDGMTPARRLHVLCRLMPITYRIDFDY